LFGANIQDIVVESSAATDLGGEGIVLSTEKNVTDVVINNNFVNNTASKTQLSFFGLCCRARILSVPLCIK
jgi:hypothetical protein